MTSIAVSATLALGLMGLGLVTTPDETAGRTLSNGLVWLAGGTDPEGGGVVSIVDSISHREVQRVTVGQIGEGWSTVGGRRDGYVADPASGRILRIDGRTLGSPSLFSPGAGPDPALGVVALDDWTYVVRPGIGSVEGFGPRNEAVAVPGLSAAIGVDTGALWVLADDRVGLIEAGELVGWSEPTGITEGRLAVAGDRPVVVGADGEAWAALTPESLAVESGTAGLGVDGPPTGTEGGWVVATDGATEMGGVRVLDGLELRLRIPGARTLGNPVSAGGLVYLPGTDESASPRLWVIDPDARRIQASSALPSDAAFVVEDGTVWQPGADGSAIGIGSDGAVIGVEAQAYGGELLTCQVSTADGTNPEVGETVAITPKRSDGGTTSPARWVFDETISPMASGFTSTDPSPRVSWTSGGPKRVKVTVETLTTTCTVMVEGPLVPIEASTTSEPTVETAAEVDETDPTTSIGGAGASTTSTSTTSTSSTSTTTTTTTTPPTTAPPVLVVVPSLTGQASTTAQSSVQRLGLVVKVAIKDLPAGSSDDGKVVDQLPPAGTQLASGSTVTITIGKAADAPPPKIVVPDVFGQTASQARVTLTNSGLNVIESTVELGVGDAQDGKVVTQIPVKGSSVERGTPVTINVGKAKAGPNVLPVPNLKGKTEADARSALSAVGLLVTVVTVDVANGSADDGKVTAQDPGATTSVAVGTTVKITVGKAGPAPKCNVVSVVGMGEAQARNALGANCNLVVTRSNVAPFDDLVASQSPGAGTSLNAGSNVNVTITVGPVCVVSDVKGFTDQQARTALANCAVGAFAEETVPFPGQVVLRQSVGAGRYPAGTSVTLWEAIAARSVSATLANTSTPASAGCHASGSAQWNGTTGVATLSYTVWSEWLFAGCTVRVTATYHLADGRTVNGSQLSEFPCSTLDPTCKASRPLSGTDQVNAPVRSISFSVTGG